MAEHELNKIVDDDGEVFNLRDSTKQPVADRVTSWSGTPSDTKYPSEKLVKTSLDGKQNTLPTTGTASDTYAINVSGKAYQLRSIEVKSPQSDKCWAKIAETTNNTTSDYHIAFSVHNDGYAVKSAYIGILSVAIQQTGQGTTGRFAVYFYRADAVEFDAIKAVLVNTGTVLELWVCNKRASQYIYFTPLHSLRLSPVYGQDRVYTQDEFDAYISGKSYYPSVEKGINRSGTDAVGSSSIPVWVDANGTLTQCTDDFVHDGDVTSTYSATGTDPVNGTAVAAAISGKADKVSITGATKCKITYNSQGIVTAGADLANTDLPKFIYNCGYASTRMNGAPAYDSSTPYKLIGKCTYPTSGNRTAWERFLLMYADTLFEFKLKGVWGSSSTSPSLSIHPIAVYGTSLNNTKTRFYPRYSFAQNSATGLVIEFYVKFTGDWQNFRLYQLPAQSGDNGATEFNAFTMSTNATAIATLPNTAIDFYSGDDKVTVFGQISSADKATNDSDGNAINSTYLKLSGGTMTGKITAWGSKYTDDGTTGAIDMQNSNIVGLNSIYTKDASENASEGIHFYRDATHTDTLWMAGGHMYFVPNRTLAGSSASTSAADSKKVAILPASITSGHVVVTDGTSGDVKGVAASTLTVGVASKLGTANKGSTTKPIYLAAGVPTECTTYAGGTAVTLNNASKAGSTASFYAPTAGGTANYVLIGNGTTSAPTWAEKAPKASAADTAAKIATSAKIGDTNKPVYVAADGTITAISYTIATSVPSGAVFTDTKQNITLATTTKAFITGVSTTPTGTAQALTGLADTGVYLTKTAGELNATQYKVDEHCTMKYNSTKSSLDFTFS